MAQLIAAGKWSKVLKNWTMVVAIRRPGEEKAKRRSTRRRARRPVPR